MVYDYLLFNLLIILLPTVSMALYKRSIKPKLTNTILSIILVGGPFVLWDILVTQKFWFFNTDYIIGIYIGKVPLEELLFFVAVGYALLCLHVNFKQIVKKTVEINRYYIIISTLAMSIMCIISSIKGWFYSFCVFVLILISIKLEARNNYSVLRTMSFWLMAVVTILLTLLFNYYLTSKPIVTYNYVYTMGIRINAMPVEDIVYGLLYAYFIIFFYEKPILRLFESEK